MDEGKIKTTVESTYLDPVLETIEKTPPYEEFIIEIVPLDQRGIIKKNRRWVKFSIATTKETPTFYYIAIDSETLEKMAVYQRLNEETIWVRPLKMFEEFVLIEGQQISLFSKDRIISYLTVS